MDGLAKDVQFQEQSDYRFYKEEEDYYESYECKSIDYRQFFVVEVAIENSYSGSE